MATKRLKFLRRVKILQEDVVIAVEVRGATKRFRAELRLDRYGFPRDAEVVIEARQLLKTVRFPLGAIAQLAPAVVRDISALLGERVIFTVVVIDPSNSRKLGVAETIRPVAGDSVASSSNELLPVDASSSTAPLVWFVDYADRDQMGATDAPVLKVDADAAQHSGETFLRDATIRAVVIPAAVHGVLTKVLLVDRHEFDVDSVAWRDCWLRFGKRMTSEDPPEHDDANFEEEAAGWVLRVCERVAQEGRLLEECLRERTA